MSRHKQILKILKDFCDMAYSTMTMLPLPVKKILENLNNYSMEVY